MDEKLVDAYWHARHRLFGRRLRPLTLRHCFVLATAGNPLIEGGKLPGIDDIIQAVEICSRDSRFFLRGDRPNWFARQWVGFCSAMERAPLAKIAAYISDYAASPEVWQKAGAEKPKMHWAISTVGGLCYWCGISPETAWEMSPGEAQWMLAAAIDQSPNASIDLVTDAQRLALASLEVEGRAA